MDDALRRFDDIRPFEPEELPAAYERLLADEAFLKVLEALYPGVPTATIARQMSTCKTSLDFQKTFCYGFIKNLLAKASTGQEIVLDTLDAHRRYTFVSNHRDIVLDPGIFAVLLIEAGWPTTCEIAIGDNLLSLPWVKDLVRINKSFIVRRGISMRQMLVASRMLAEYMHYAIDAKKENIWIAQREGRAKDSNDRTSEAVLKMMAMGGEGSVVERLKRLHIVPLSISYEYDPCDYLKAAEFQLRRDNAAWEKGPMDDILSMKTGIMGYKGHVHYHCAPCIDDYLDGMGHEVTKADVFRQVAAHIDREIHRNYRLYPCNYVALDELYGHSEHTAHYTPADKASFDDYIAGQLEKIALQNKDEAFLRERLLTMYANPAVNYIAARETER